MIYFVRHGQTEGNLRHIFIGELNFPLTELGISQAKETAEKLKDVKIDRIFCSPLLRAKQTMEEIAKFHPNALVTFDDRLKERGDGALEGKVLGKEDFFRWDLNSPQKEEYGETIPSAFARVKNFYDECIQKYPFDDILVVAHVGIGRLSKCYFDGFPKDGNLNVLKIDNGEIVILKK